MSECPLPPLRVAPGGRYFETTNGESFLFIGPNDAISWPGLAGIFRRRDVASADRYLQSLAAHGITILRLMLEYAHDDSHYFERPYGRFNPSMIAFWDDLFALCARHGLRILLTPWDNFWMARRWHKHPYNRVNGGPAHSPAAFFLDDAVVQATIRRVQFVIERWGGSGVLAAWDLFNEIDPYWGGTPPQQAEVITRLSREIRQMEMRCRGWTSLQTVSIFGPEPDAAYEHLIFRHPALDFATTHIYQGAIDYPRDTVEPALAMGRWVRHALQRTPADRPFVDTEHGPIHLFNDHKKFLPEDLDTEYERHLMWAHLASGGAGSGMRWPARHPHVLSDGMKTALAGLAAFAREVDWRCFRSVPAEDTVVTDVPALQVFACRSPEQAIVWLLHGYDKKSRKSDGLLPEREPLQNARLTIRSLAPGSYSVQLWNTRQGATQGMLFADTDAKGTLNLTLPPLDKDLALAVSRKRACQNEGITEHT